MGSVFVAVCSRSRGKSGWDSDSVSPRKHVSYMETLSLERCLVGESH